MPSSPSPLALDEENIDVSRIIADMNSRMAMEAEESSDTDNSDQFPEPKESNINGLSVRFPGNLKPAQTEILTDLTFNLQRKRNGLIECPQERARRQAELAAFLAFCCEGRAIRGYRNRAEAQLVPDPEIRGPPPTAKLIFVTKTFQDIDQVISDLQMFKKTGYLEHITLNILGHHSQICGQSCSGSNPPDFGFINPSNGTINTIGKLRGVAQRKRFCAYKFCKENVNSCNILICPQDIILSPFWRNFFNITLDQVVIIFDDGGNIETALADQGSISIPTFMLKQAGNNLLDFANSASQHVPEQFALIEEIRGLSSLLITFANKIESDHYSALERKPNNLQRLREVGLGQNEVNLRLGQFQRFFAISHDLKTEVKLEERTVANVSKFFNILSQLFDHQTDNSSGLEFTTHLTDFQQAVRFNVNCNKPSIYLEPFLEKKATIMISSGCLPPIQVLCHEFNTFTEKTVIEEQSITNCLIAYVSGSNGVKLGFSEKDLSRSTVQLEAGDAVLEMCKPVEGGTIVCFSSRKQLSIITRCWEDTNNREKSILDEIKESKNFYSEHGLFDEGDCKRNLEKFLENCKKPVGSRNGAVLFALHRGKMLENLLGQGQVKLFISCGVPYSSRRDLKVMDKELYYNAILEEAESKKWSSLHYNADMFHILMQNVARSVRNGEEKIAYVILDSRMEGKAKDFEIYLPAWIRKEVKGYEDCKEMVKALNDFMG